MILLSQYKKVKFKGKLLKHLDIGYYNHKKFIIRNYLMEFIVPSLSEALIEVTDTRPDDPIDFLVFFFILLIKCFRLNIYIKKALICDLKKLLIKK